MIFIAVFISLSILIIAHELGHFFAARIFGVKVEEFGFGYPPRIFGKKIGKTIWSINALPFGGFVKIKGEDGEGDVDKNSFASQKPWKRSVMLLAGVFINLVMGFLIFCAVFMIGSSQGVAITNVSEGSPAYVVGIKSGDIISSVSSQNDSISKITNTDSFISFIHKHVQDELTLSVKRDSQTVLYTLQGRENPPEGQGSLGIELINLGMERLSFFSAIGSAFQATVNITSAVVQSFVSLFLNIFVNPSVIQNIAGPVGIFSIAGKAGNFGFAYLLEIIGIISINLAVLNCIPFPALDGGRALMIIIEKFKGSPVSKKSQQIVNTIGFAALLILMVFVTVQDVSKLIH